MRDPHDRYFVYMLRCSDKSYYTGITNNVEVRVLQHQEGGDSSCYTFKRRPVLLVFQQGFRDVSVAIEHEKRLKRWRREKKEALIKGQLDLLPELAKKKFH